MQLAVNHVCVVEIRAEPLQSLALLQARGIRLSMSQPSREVRVMGVIIDSGYPGDISA